MWVSNDEDLWSGNKFQIIFLLLLLQSLRIDTFISVSEKYFLFFIFTLLLYTSLMFPPFRLCKTKQKQQKQNAMLRYNLKCWKFLSTFSTRRLFIHFCYQYFFLCFNYWLFQNLFYFYFSYNKRVCVFVHVYYDGVNNIWFSQVA